MGATPTKTPESKISLSYFNPQPLVPFVGKSFAQTKQGSLDSATQFELTIDSTIYGSNTPQTRPTSAKRVQYNLQSQRKEFY